MELKKKMEEKMIEDEIELKRQVLRNKAKTELDKWYLFESEYRIIKPYKSEGFRIELLFPSDVRTGINPSEIQIQGGKEKRSWMARYSHADDYELKNLHNEVCDLRRRNSHLQSMIEVFWNIHGFKDKHLLMKKVRLESIKQVFDWLEWQKEHIEEEYGDDDYLNVIDEFKKELNSKIEELESDFIKESDHWKLWRPEDYEKPVVSLEL